MIFDVAAVMQVAHQYHGFYNVKGESSDEKLQYKSDTLACTVDIDCKLGEITVTLQEEYRGKVSAMKKTIDYNTIHEILNDPRLLFMDDFVKPQKRRKSVEQKTNDEEPLTFSISAFNKTSKPPAAPSLRPSLPPKKLGLQPLRGGHLDLGGDLGSDLGSLGPPVPTLGPKKEKTRVERMREEEELKLKARGIDKNKPAAKSNGQPIHQDLLAMDYLYKTKTKNELNYLKRQIETGYDTTDKKAKLSHKQNIDKYNKYLAAIPEQNECRKINWHKH